MKMRAFLIVALIFSCQAEKNLRIWKGTDFYASWTAGGSNRPSGSQQRSYEVTKSNSVEKFKFLIRVRI